MVQGIAMCWLRTAFLAVGVRSIALRPGNSTSFKRLRRSKQCACKEGVEESACQLTDNQKPRFYHPTGSRNGATCCKEFSSDGWARYERVWSVYATLHDAGEYFKSSKTEKKKKYVKHSESACAWDERSAEGRCCRTSDGSGFEVSKVKRRYKEDGQWSAPQFDMGDITVAKDSDGEKLELSAAKERLNNNIIDGRCKEDMKKIEDDAPCVLAEPIKEGVCCCHKYDENTTRAASRCLKVDKAPGEAQVADIYKTSAPRPITRKWKEWVWNDKRFHHGRWYPKEKTGEELYEPVDPPSIDESGKGMEDSLTRPDPDLKYNEDLKTKEFGWALAEEQWERTCKTYRAIESLKGTTAKQTYIPDRNSCSEREKEKGYAGQCPHLEETYTWYSTKTETKCEMSMWKRRCGAGHALYNREPKEATPGSCGQSSMGNDNCPPNYVVKKGGSVGCTCEPECK